MLIHWRQFLWENLDNFGLKDGRSCRGTGKILRPIKKVLLMGGCDQVILQHWMNKVTWQSWVGTKIWSFEEVKMSTQKKLKSFWQVKWRVFSMFKLLGSKIRNLEKKLSLPLKLVISEIIGLQAIMSSGSVKDILPIIKSLSMWFFWLNILWL